jgi:hypothetical protein
VAQPTIETILLNAHAFMPRAGQTLSLPPVQVRLSTNEIVVAESVSCTLTYRGKRLVPVGPSAWRIPGTYRKQGLELTVTASYRGATSTVSVPVTPR